MRKCADVQWTFSPRAIAKYEAIPDLQSRYTSTNEPVTVKARGEIVRNFCTLPLYASRFKPSALEHIDILRYF
jgi:hypothetical protein